VCCVQWDNQQRGVIQGVRGVQAQILKSIH